MKYFHYRLARLIPSLHVGFSSATARLVVIIAATVYATTATAGAPATGEKTDATTTAYVDSVFQWGAWELDIEPAAGGLQAATTRPLNSRESSLTLRTNSISALAPLQRPGAQPEFPIALPVIPPTVTPPVIIRPIVVPISTNVPVSPGAP